MNTLLLSGDFGFCLCNINEGKFYLNSHQKSFFRSAIPYENGLVIASRKEELQILDVFDLSYRTKPEKIFEKKCESEISDLLWLNRPNVLCSLEGKKIRVWDVDSLKCMGMLEAEGYVENISVMNKRMLVSSGEGTNDLVKVWDVEKMKIEKTLPFVSKKVEVLGEKNLVKMHNWNLSILDRENYEVVKEWKFKYTLDSFLTFPETQKSVAFLTSGELCFVDHRKEGEILWKGWVGKSITHHLKVNSNQFVITHYGFVDLWNIESQKYDKKVKTDGYVKGICNFVVDNNKLPKSYLNLSYQMKKVDLFEKKLEKHKDNLVYPIIDYSDFVWSNGKFDHEIVQRMKNLSFEYDKIICENRKRMYNEKTVTVCVCKGFTVYKRYEGEQKGLKPHGKGNIFWKNAVGVSEGLEEQVNMVFDGIFENGRKKFGKTFQFKNSGITFSGKFSPFYFNSKNRVIDKEVTFEVPREEKQWFNPTSASLDKGVHFESGFLSNDYPGKLRYIKLMSHKEGYTRSYTSDRELHCDPDKGYPIIDTKLELNDVVLKENETWFDVVEDVIKRKFLEENLENRKTIKGLQRKVKRLEYLEEQLKERSARIEELKGNLGETKREFQNEKNSRKRTEERLNKELLEVKEKMDWSVSIRDDKIEDLTSKERELRKEWKKEVEEKEKNAKELERKNGQLRNEKVNFKKESGKKLFTRNLLIIFLILLFSLIIVLK